MVLKQIYTTYNDQHNSKDNDPPPGKCIKNIF